MVIVLNPSFEPLLESFSESQGLLCKVDVTVFKVTYEVWAVISSKSHQTEDIHKKLTD